MSEAPTRFLLIDDNPHDRGLTLRQLRREFPGCQVEQVTARSGFETALERGDFDLVITDYHLHWSDGLSVLQAVKARRPDCPVLMFTGTGTEEVAVEAMRAGLDDYIVKSVAHFVRVSAAARAALEHAGDRRALEATRDALGRSEDAERRFHKRLTTLHAVTNELSTVDSFDELCRRAVELGRSRLGFDRLSLWFVGEEPYALEGSFGVDEHGEVRDERGQRMAIDRDSAVGQILAGRVPSILLTDAPVFDDRNRVIGRGYVAAAALWDGQEVIGYVVTDNLLRQKPTTERDRDVLRLYASALGHLCSRKRAEEQTRLLSQHLRQTQKMEAIGRLAGGVAHDFNNLLTAISGYAEMLLASLGDDDPARHEVQGIREAAARAAALTRQLLAFSRRQMLQPTALDLNIVVADMGEMLGRVIGEHVELVTRLAPDLGAIEADRSQVEQVIVNLAVNARDAMPEGGTLAITTANADLGGAFAREHADVEPGPYVLLSVSDTGRGMSAETLSRAFEPFFTTKGPGEGTGLGLATVHGIVKQSGGHVAARSEPGKGTTIDVYLPRTEAAAPAARRRPLPDAALHGSETILLVEDEDMVRDLARTVLEQHGYTVLEARDGAEALRICEQADQPIHLAVTDVVMPRMDGTELATRLQALSPDTRVLYISGYADHTIVCRGADDPASPFLHKPFTPAALAAKVREVLDTPLG